MESAISLIRQLPENKKEAKRFMEIIKNEPDIKKHIKAMNYIYKKLRHEFK